MKSGSNVVRKAGQRAALIADITAAPLRGNSSGEFEATLLRLAQAPLSLFQFLNARPLLSLLHPDAAGPSAQIRSKIATILVSTVAQPKQETHFRTETDGQFEKSPNLDDLVRFQPSADDIAEALDDHLVAARPRASIAAALVLIVSIPAIATCFIFWMLR